MARLPICGSEMIYGNQTEDAVDRMVAPGTSREDAEKCAKYPNHSTFTECPTPERHKMVIHWCPLMDWSMRRTTSRVEEMHV